MRSLPTVRSIRAIDKGNAYHNGRAFARMRSAPERSAHERGALPHADQAKTLLARAECPLGVEPIAVVLDDEPNVIGTTFEQDGDVSGAGVFGDVGERLLHHAIENSFDVVLQPILVHAVAVQLRVHTETPRPTRHKIRECD